MVSLDFDGLDGSLLVPTGSHTPTNNDALPDGQDAGGETAALDFTEPVEGAVDDINLLHTEPVKYSADNSSTAHTEPVLVAIDDIKIGDQESAEHAAADRAAGTQALQATSDRLAAIRLRELGDDDLKSHPTIPSLSEQVSPELLSNIDKTSTGRPQHGLRHALTGPIVAFLAGIIIGGGVLYFWANGELWQSEPPINVADSVTLLKPHTEPITLPSISKGLVRQESDSIAQSTAVDDPALLPLSSSREAEHSTSPLTTTSNEPINTDLSVQSPTSIENHSTSPKEIDTLGQRNTDSAPITDDGTKNSKSVISEKNEEAIFQDSSPKQAKPPKSWTIPFTFNKLEIDPEIINNLLPELKKCEGTLNIEGHTCTLGDEESNFYVGLARADFVRNQLVKLGISARRLRVNSVGGDRPVATNSTKQGRTANRRVVIDCRSE